MSPSSIMSALTYVLIDKLVKLSTYFLYFENLSLINKITCTMSEGNRVAPEFKAGA